MRKKKNRSIAVLLVVAILLSGKVSLDGSELLKGSTARAAVTLHNPTYDSGVQKVAPGTQDVTRKLRNPTYDAAADMAEWDCVWFGNYWQSDTNGDGVGDERDAKESIKWRVLSVDGDDVFLLADTNLDVKPYNETYTDVTWETCTLRSWLNGYGSGDNVCGTDYTLDNFMDNAFSAAEQTVIRTASVRNEDNPYYDTEGGNDTKDKIYLLSIAEASNEAYGFCGGFQRRSDTRVGRNTAYVAEYSDMSPGEADLWCLRSPGGNGLSVAGVSSDGYGYGHGFAVGNGIDVIRPALHLTLSSSTPLSYAGTVSSDGTVTDADGNILTPTPTSFPTATPTNKPTAAPTSKPTAAPIAKPTVKPTTEPTAGATVCPVSPTKSPVGGGTDTTPAPGQMVKDSPSGAFYQIVSTGNTNAAVTYIRPETKTKKLKVPAAITYAGKRYKVTSIAKKAFAANKKLKTLVIGKNVKTIQKNAFKNCKNLRKITVKSKVLTKVGKNAFKGTIGKVTVKVPKKKKAKYDKLFKGKGNKKVKVV